MTYLQQKKRQQKIHSIFSIAFILLALSTACIFTENKVSATINNYRLQLYYISIILLIFSLYITKFKYILISLLFVLINYTFINSYTNFFKNQKVSTNNTYNIKFNKKQNSVFEVIDINNQSFIVVNLKNKKDTKESLKLIEDFIISTDKPISVIGNLGAPLWNKNIKTFMQKTGLKAKNKIIFDNLSPFYIPTINVLGFENIGVKEIIKKNNGYEFILLAK